MVVALVVLAAMLITLTFRGYGIFQSVEDAARSAASRTGDFAASVFSPVSGAWNAAWSYDDLEQKNQDLRVELEQLKAAGLGEQIASARLAKLYEDLDLTQLAEIPQTIAQVIVPQGNFQSDLIQISKGSSHGLEVGQPVVVAAGLVGRVAEVRQNRAFVRTLASADFLVGVRFLDTGQVEPAVSLGVNGLLQVSQPTSETAPAIGALAVTSGLERSVYPPGILVGAITDIEVEAGTLTNLITITPAVEVLDLSFVAVLDYETDLRS